MTDSKTGGDFTRGRILPQLTGFALPVFLALFLQSMYGAADLIIVGKFSDAAQMSAVATGTLVMQTITAVIAGLTTGTTVLIGRKLGERRAREAALVIGSSIVLFAAIGAAVALAMQPLARPLAALMQAPHAAFTSTVSYVRICAGGAVFIVAYNVLGGIFRGIGDARVPLLSVSIAGVLNIGGDLLAVAVLKCGAAGAAAATVAAQGASVALSLLIIRRRRLPFTFTWRDVRWRRAQVGAVLKLGWPIALCDLLVNISFLVVTAIVNTLGVAASAGVGVAEKVCGFIMLVPSAFSQSMSAFVAQNAGAQLYDRARAALRCGILISLAVGLAVGSFAFWRGDLLAGIFARDAAVIANAWQYLRAYAIDCLLVSFLFCFIGYFNGLGHTSFVMAQGIVGAFLVRIPASFLFSRIEPVSLFRIGLATPCSTVVQIILCAAYLIYLKRHRPTGTHLF